MTTQRGAVEEWLGVSRSGLATLGGLVLVVGIALGLVAFGLWGGSGGGSADDERVAAREFSQAQRAAADGPCTAPPQVDATAMELTQAGLTVTAALSTSCGNGDVVTGSSAQVAVSVGDRDFASGVFDLSANPIALPADGGQVQRVFVFPLRMYWRPPDLLGSATPDVTLTNFQHATPGASGSAGSGATLTATAPAAPAHGNADVTAASALEELSGNDFQNAKNSLENWWVPQVSSKKLGLTANGIVYDNAEILFDHLQRRQSGNVQLLWSPQWTTFSRSADFWVTVANQPYRTPEEANGWCDAKGIDPDNCFAKLISTTYPPEGSTKFRG